ncbi:MAG: TIGR01777 family oxidoreductase [Ignavibacteriaceae bacterium]|nr:TIGR01777 family oxidoreductase [Ignavibacteriaceae bacterium]
MKKILITGATGLIGRELCKTLSSRGDELTIFSTNVERAKTILPFAKEVIAWKDYEKDYSTYIEGKDAVIHLAGASVAGKRWTINYKNEIYDSRIHTTNNLVSSIALCKDKPKVFISASAIGFYGEGGSSVLTEASPNGKDFLSNVCMDWEKASGRLETFNMRRAIVRTGIVLSTNDGALKKMLLPFQFYLGGPLGNGRQWFSWVHIADIISLYLFLLDNQKAKGIFNAVSPQPVQMKTFADTLGKVLHKPSIFSVPKFVLRLVMGESASAILESQKVMPEALLQAGFKFKYENLEEALNDLLKIKPVV